MKILLSKSFAPLKKFFNNNQKRICGFEAVMEKKEISRAPVKMLGVVVYQAPKKPASFDALNSIAGSLTNQKTHFQRLSGFCIQCDSPHCDPATAQQDVIHLLAVNSINRRR